MHLNFGLTPLFRRIAITLRYIMPQAISLPPALKTLVLEA